MTTTVTLPVSYGTTLTVTCDIGYKNTGDDTITCTTDNKYSYSVQPQCIQGTVKTSHTFNSSQYDTKKASYTAITTCD